MGWFESFVDVEESRPEYTVADVLRLHWEAYRARYGATREQVKAALAIMACRTAALGGHVKICADCGYIEVSFNSCKNRNCPTCGAFERAQWLPAWRQTGRIASRSCCRSSISTLSLL